MNTLIEGMRLRPTEAKGLAAVDAQTMVEAIAYRYRYEIAWRDLSERFGAWQTG